MRRVLLLAILLLLAAASARAEILERIVAVVGEDIVLLSELDEAQDRLRGALEAEARVRIPDASARAGAVEQELGRQRPQILEQLIQEKLLLAQAKAWGLSASDEEVAESMEKFAAEQGIDLDGLRKMAAREGIGWTAYQEEWRRRIVTGRVQQRALAGRLEITEADERAYYSQHYGSPGKAEARLRLLFLKAPAAGEGREAVRKKMEKLLARIRGGKFFADVARKNTQGPNAAQGGDVGFLGKGQMQADVEKAAFGLKAGEVSGVISGAQGFSLLQMIECRGCEARAFEDVRGEIREKLTRERAPEAFEAWLKDLEEQTHIERRI